MYVSTGELKQRAKDALHGTKPAWWMIGLIVMVAVNASTWLTYIISPTQMPTFHNYEQLYAYVQQIYNTISLPLQLSMMLLNLFVGVFLVGFQWYCLRLSRGEKELQLEDLISSFHQFWKVLGLRILLGVFTFLWSLLLVVPGIIASYAYRMAPMLMMDHPDWDVLTCIRKSKELMRGRKFQLFVLDLSFIGWSLLSLVMEAMLYIPALQVWTLPYIQVTEAAFYNEISGWNQANSQDGAPGAGNPQEDSGNWWEES